MPSTSINIDRNIKVCYNKIMAEITKITPFDVAPGDPSSVHLNQLDAFLNTARLNAESGIEGAVVFDTLRGDDLRLEDGEMVEGVGQIGLLVNDALDKIPGNCTAFRSHQVDNDLAKNITYHQFSDGFVVAVEVDLQSSEAGTSTLASPHIPSRVIVRAGHNLDGIDFDKVAQ
jgi:hypothetical protein